MLVSFVQKLGESRTVILSALRLFPAYLCGLAERNNSVAPKAMHSVACPCYG